MSTRPRARARETWCAAAGRSLAPGGAQVRQLAFVHETLGRPRVKSVQPEEDAPCESPVSGELEFEGGAKTTSSSREKERNQNPEKRSEKSKAAVPPMYINSTLCFAALPAHGGIVRRAWRNTAGRLKNAHALRRAARLLRDPHSELGWIIAARRRSTCSKLAGLSNSCGGRDNKRRDRRAEGRLWDPAPGSAGNRPAAVSRCGLKYSRIAFSYSRYSARQSLGSGPVSDVRAPGPAPGSRAKPAAFRLAAWTQPPLPHAWAYRRSITISLRRVRA